MGERTVADDCGEAGAGAVTTDGDALGVDAERFNRCVEPAQGGHVDVMLAARDAMGISATVATPYLTPPEYPPGAITQDFYPGEGVYLYAYGGIRQANFITGPYGLLVADLDTTDMVDFELMHKQAMATTKAVIDLTNVPLSELETPAH